MTSGEAETGSSGLEGLLALHRAELLRFLTARCGEREEAEDLLQELWIKASVTARGPIANGRAYLFRMANNLVLDRHRARHRAIARDRGWLAVEGGGDGTPEDRADPALPADEAIARRQEADILREAIRALPPGAQRALRLHRFDGHDQAEVARIMGISRSGVEKHLALAMQHLRNALSDCGLFATAASGKQGHSGGPSPLSRQEP